MVEGFVFDKDSREEPTEEELLEEGNISAEEEAFMRGYSEEEETPVCDECGTAIKGKKITKLIDGDTFTFCCKECAKEFSESTG